MGREAEVLVKTAGAAKIAAQLPKPLRRYYEIGRRASATPKPEIEVLAKKVKLSVDYVRKARLFEQRLTDVELRLLVSTYRDQDYIFPWGHLRILVSVTDPVKRCSYLTSAIDGRWSAKQVITAVQIGEQRTLRKCVGRKQTKPKTIEEALLRLQRLMESWDDIYDAVFTATTDKAAAKKLRARGELVRRIHQVESFRKKSLQHQIKFNKLAKLLRQFLKSAK